MGMLPAVGQGSHGHRQDRRRTAGPVHIAEPPEAEIAGAGRLSRISSPASAAQDGLHERSARSGGAASP